MVMMTMTTARRKKDAVCATVHFCDSAEVGALDPQQLQSSTRCSVAATESAYIMGITTAVRVIFNRC